MDDTETDADADEEQNTYRVPLEAHTHVEVTAADEETAREEAPAVARSEGKTPDWYNDQGTQLERVDENGEVIYD